MGVLLAAAFIMPNALPYTTLVIAAVMPLAAGLYLLTTTAWAAAERAVLGPRVRRHVRTRARSA